MDELIEVYKDLGYLQCQKKVKIEGFIEGLIASCLYGKYLYVQAIYDKCVRAETDNRGVWYRVDLNELSKIFELHL